MDIHLQRITNDRHRLTIVRADNSREACELETRSVLLHDLVHFAVEAEARMEDGFWGLVASGFGFAELRAEAESPTRRGIHLAESLVGPMQAVWNGRLDPDRYVAHAEAHAPFVDREFVDRVLERLRRLWGHWSATGFHEVMTLRWPPESGIENPAHRV